MSREAAERNGDVLSVLLIVTGNEASAAPCLDALAGQRGAPAMEVVVPLYPSLHDVAALRQRWAGVRFIEMPDAPPPDGPAWEHWKVDRQRSVGIEAAQGNVIAMLQDNASPGDDWCAQVWAEHSKRPDCAIGGGIEYGGRSRLDRAVFYCDFGRYQPPFPETRAGYASVLNVSYKKAALMRCKDVWAEFFDESVVHGRIAAEGGAVLLSPARAVRYRPGKMPLRLALRRKMASGRAFAARRVRETTGFRRWVLAGLSLGLAPVMLLRQFGFLRRRGQSLAPWLGAAPLIFLCLLFWSLGELKGYTTGRPFPAPREVQDQ